MPRKKKFTGPVSFPAGTIKTAVVRPDATGGKAYELRRPVYTLDLETDPLDGDKIPEPFAAGIYNGEEYRDFISDDPRAVIAWVAEILKFLPDRSIVYVHNGGKFDFMLMQDFLNTSKDQPLAMVGSRLARIDVGDGRSVELRDSYCAVPIPLREWKKDDIDYQKMARDQRHAHMAEIRQYLRADCTYLHTLVCGFIDRWGFKLTIAAGATDEMLRTAEVVRGLEWSGELGNLGRKADKLFRKFYFGGRVEVFKRGELRGKFKVYDANSAYPNALARYEHPATEKHFFTRNPAHIETCSFADVTGTARGCFPLRTEDGGLEFPHRWARYLITGHELRAAIKHGLFDLETINGLWVFAHRRNYAGFVWHHYGEKRRNKEAARDALRRGEEGQAAIYRLAELFHKLALNSTIGKLGQNPDEHREFILTRELLEKPWRMEPVFNFPIDVNIFSRKLRYSPEEREKLLARGWTEEMCRDVKSGGYRLNVATAASIVGAARAEIMPVIAQSKGVVLCDTDSVICEEFAGGAVDPFELGAWDLEQEGDYLACAGRKMYALVDTTQPEGARLVKIATKGVRLDLDGVVQVIREGQSIYRSLAPSWSFISKTAPQFITRTVRPT